MKNNHGDHNKKRTSEQEAEITDLIHRDYIGLGKLLTCETFRVLAAQYARERGEAPTGFTCSNHFFQSFKARTRLSSRRFHMRHRNPTGTEETIFYWIRKIKDLLLEYQDMSWLELNCDETAGRIIPSGLLTWARLVQIE
jgi:hypothetical protein